MNKIELAQAVRRHLETELPILPVNIIAGIEVELAQANLWEVANLLGHYAAGLQSEDPASHACFAIITEIRRFQGERAHSSTAPTTVVFGTSGWRGVIGEDFTILNVHKVTRAIIAMMQTPQFLQTNGYQSWADVQQHGICVFRDNRFLGDEFIAAAKAELAAAQIRIYDAGQCPTGVGSMLVQELAAAGSLNFTPSHNPMDYAGLKFNPGDGGPADQALTTIIEDYANAMMRPGYNFHAASTDPSQLCTCIDAADQMRQFLDHKSPVFDMPRIRTWLRREKANLFLLIDNMHGSSRGYIQAILGHELIHELEDAGAIAFVHTVDDYAFHGLKPEPSAANQRPLINKLQHSGRRYTLAAALDPDADRIRFADANMDIDMNRFGAIAMAQLLERDVAGGLAYSVATSEFAAAIARANGRRTYATAVGFKNFRPMLSSGEAMLAFEESDGITFRGHTLEKCGIAGMLAALDAMARTGANLSEQYQALQQRYGYFYPERAGEDVKGVDIDAWQAYKGAVLNALQDSVRVGDTLTIGDTTRCVSEVNSLDGVKLMLDNGSWLLLRPSGTEPKFRYYFELASSEPIAEIAQLRQQYRDAASALLRRARSAVETAAG